MCQVNNLVKIPTEIPARNYHLSFKTSLPRRNNDHDIWTALILWSITHAENPMPPIERV